MVAKQIKSRKRVVDHGEVFTSGCEVNAMLDLVKQETERIDSRFLEPACGDGNFLTEILCRKLSVVKKKYRKSPIDYEKNAVLAATSIYGVDILYDNVEACRKRMFNIWNKEYTAVCKTEANDDCREAVKFIFKRNILCGDALSMKTLVGEPIVFSEWAFITGFNLQRSDYRLDKLLEGDGKAKDLFSVEQEKRAPSQQSLFDTGEKLDDEGQFVQKYITHYRSVNRYE